MYASGKSKGKVNGGEEVMMSEEMTDTAQTDGASEQWSSVESLTPLGEQLIQIPVSHC